MYNKLIPIAGCMCAVVHPACLERWINTRPATGGDRHTCEVCMASQRALLLFFSCGGLCFSHSVVILADMPSSLQHSCGTEAWHRSCVQFRLLGVGSLLPVCLYPYCPRRFKCWLCCFKHRRLLAQAIHNVLFAADDVCYAAVCYHCVHQIW